jgi:transposase
MIPLPNGSRVWLATGHTDMRRGYPSLALLVQEQLKLDPHDGNLYIFRGRRAQPTTFRIQFALCDNRLSLAPSFWPDPAGIAVPARQRFAVHLHGREAGPLP